MSSDDLSTQSEFPKLQTPFVKENRKDPAAGRLIDIPWYRLLIALWNRTGGTSGNAANSIQPGTILPFGGAVAPEGYLLCNHQEVTVAAFPNLFAAIGRTWGAGDGVTTFNVPNLIDRTLFGAGSSFALGDLFGSATHALTSDENGPHVHNVNDPGHQHEVNTYLNGGALDLISRQLTASAPGPNFTPTTNVVTGVTVDSSGLGTPFSIIPPGAGVNYIIKT